jgi:AraC family transcriptional regulator
MPERCITILKRKRPSPTGFTRTLSSANTPWSGFQVEEHQSPETGSESQWYYPNPHVVLHTGGYSQFRFRDVAGAEQRTVLEPDTVALLPKDYEMSFSWEGACRFLVVELNTRMVGRQFDGDEHSPPPSLISAKRLKDPSLLSLMKNIEAEVRAGSPTGRLYGESLSIALSAYVMTRYSAIKRPMGAAGIRHTFSAHQSRHLIDYICEHLSMEIGIAELAALVNLSPFHFCRMFRKSFGVSPHRYLMQQRVNAAKKLLAQQGLEIAHVAASVGYATQSHFTAVFKRLTGMTPRHFRLER